MTGYSSLVRTCSVAITLGLLWGCTTPDPLYCDAQKPCEDPALVCNLTTNTCEAQKDAGLPDGYKKPDSGEGDLTVPDGPATDGPATDGPTPDKGGDQAMPDLGQDQAVDALLPDAAQPTCGDGKKNGSELCDKADLGGKSCKALGYASGTLKCTPKCAFDTAGCVAPAKCGDGKINDTGEQCDKTELGGKSCTSQGYAGGTLTCSTSCKLDASACFKCGDGKINGADKCDGAALGGETCKGLGYASGTLTCKKDCTFDTAGCVAPAKCGDSKINAAAEQCDKTALGGKTCKTQGFAGGTLKCSSSCKLDTASCYKCGDKKINGTEVCDGVLHNGKTCKTQGYWSGTLSCKPGCAAFDTSKCHYCGNGVLNPGEKCDTASLAGKSCGGLGFDGGTVACKSDCTFDTSKCHKCGDGKVSGPELCDGTLLAGKTCKTAGFDGGTVKCKSNCTLDAVGCYRNWTMEAGSGHACGLDTAGKLWCWGHGELLGNGPSSGMTIYNTPQLILSGVKQVSVGDYHTCAVLANGSLRCWGNNDKGQLGDGTVKGRYLPTKVGSYNTWSSVSVGFAHSCGMMKNNTLWCWGHNQDGQLGDGYQKDSLTPSQAGIATDWSSVSAGGNYTCGLKNNGTLWCWGGNGSGQHGDGTKKDKTNPTQIGSLKTWNSIEAGSITCGVRTDGTLWCAGGSNLGDGSTAGSSVFVKVPSSKGWKSISNKFNTTCGLKTDGTVWCWGSKNLGQIGDGTTKDRLSPVQVGNHNNWLSVATSGYSFQYGSVSCGSRTDGTAWCWGAGAYGQLGNGSNGGSMVPTKVTK